MRKVSTAIECYKTLFLLGCKVYLGDCYLLSIKLWLVFIEYRKNMLKDWKDIAKQELRGKPFTEATYNPEGLKSNGCILKKTSENAVISKAIRDGAIYSRTASDNVYRKALDDTSVRRFFHG